MSAPIYNAAVETAAIAPPAAPVAWTSLLALAAADLVIHLLSAAVSPYGYMSDELYYLDCTRHLAWGYVDHPPLSVALLSLVRLTLGDSLLALRLVSALAGSTTIVFAGLTAQQLGGGRTAQSLAGFATLAFPLYLAVGGFYSMNALEPLLWAAAIYLVLRLLNGAGNGTWIALGAIFGLGLLNKVSMAWLGVGLFVGMLLTERRRWLLTPWPWCAGSIAIVLFAPHIVWQLQNEWPTLEFMRNAAKVKMVEKSLLDFLGDQILIVNPVLVPFLLAGLAYLFLSVEAVRYRLLGWVWITVLLLLIGSGIARSYYMGPAYLALLGASGVAVERLSRRWSWRWMPPTLATLFCLSSLVMAPMAISLLPPNAFIAYQRAIGVAAPSDQKDDSGVMPLHYALRFGWPQLVGAVAHAYAGLPPEDRARAGIMAQTFGESGALNQFGPEMGLPAAVGTHNNYWLWGPGGYTGEVMVISADPKSKLLDLFAEVERVGGVDCDLCMPQLRAKSIYVCRRSRRPLAELWPELKEYW